MSANQHLIRTDRRLHRRYTPKTTVYLQFPQKAAIAYKVRNLSAAGIFIVTEGLGLTIGTQVALVFALGVNGIKKLHRRRGTVVHKSGDGFGLQMWPDRRA